MKIAYIEFEVDDDFDAGECNSCPFSYWSEHYDGYVCSLWNDECGIKFRKKEGKRNEQQTKNRSKRH